MRCACAYITPQQYEVSIPLSRAHTCFSALADKLYGTEQRWRGFRAPGLVRFVKGESGFLSPTNGGTRVYINIEDYGMWRTLACPRCHPHACQLG